ncbi:MAG: hypothetical protein ACREF3_03490 [Acetobacteraceae bacterium]
MVIAANSSPPENPVELTTELAEAFETASQGVLTITNHESISREKGYYGVLYAKPSGTVRAILSLDREILVLISTFLDQQSRTIQTARELIEISNGRLEASHVIVLHRDLKGNLKLKT